MESKLIGLLVIGMILFSLVGGGLASVRAHGDEDLTNPDHHEMMGSSFWGSGMMGGFGGVGYGFMWIFWVLIIIVLVLLIVWLIKQLQKDERRRK